jgi:subtilisin family serine protease
MKRCFSLSLAAALALGACSDQQDPNPENTAPGSEFASTSGVIGINVVLKAPATAGNRAELGKYGTLLDEIPELNAIRVRAQASQLPAIQALPFVESATPDAERQAIPIDLIDATNFADGQSAWDQDVINVTEFGTTERQVPYDGSGIFVGVLDTGLLPTWRQYLPEERIAEEYAIEFAGGGQDQGVVVTQPDRWQDDVNSHGIHVASTILGYQSGTRKINGTAPLATVIPVKVLGQNGSGWSSAIARGIVHVTDLKKSGALGTKPVVINMSLGGSQLDAIEKAAIDYAIANGVIIVASAGNDGEKGMGYPGAYAPVISAAATGWVKQWSSCVGRNPANSWWRTCDVPETDVVGNTYIADFSARAKTGQDLDVAAPGAWVVGPYQTNQSNTNTLFFLSGTSMASPHVAGIVALMAQKDPTLNAAGAEAALEGSAIPIGAGSRNIFDPSKGPHTVSWGTNATGAGLVTADGALGLSSRRRR